LLHHEDTKSTKFGWEIFQPFVLFVSSWRQTASRLSLSTSSTRADAHDWKRDFYLWLPLACASWWLAWYFQDQFISDWDGFDYTTYTVRHLPTALGLGRALFLGYNYLLWEAAHRWVDVPPEQAYLVIRYGVIAQTGIAIIGIYALCKELTARRLAAFFGALIVAASPYFIIYSGRAMSEIPAFLLLSWALWWMLRSLRCGQTGRFLIAACLVGLSANLREFALFYLPFIPLAAWVYERRWRLCLSALALAVVCTFAGMIFWASFDYLYLPTIMKWWRLSAQERHLNPVTLENFRFLTVYAFHCSAITTLLTPLALAWLWTQVRSTGFSRKDMASTLFRLKPVLLTWEAKQRSALFLFGLCGLLANLVLLANHDLSVNPRYLLTGLLGLAAVCGWCLAEMFSFNRVRGAMLLAGLLMLTLFTYLRTAKDLYDSQWNARGAREYVEKIKHLPWNSGFIVGARTPLIGLLAGVRAKPHWLVIPPGSGWPDDKLDKALDDFFYAGRMVYVDFDPELWQTGAREKSREAAGLEKIKREYELEHIRDQFYRIVGRRSVLTGERVFVATSLSISKARL
jgi:hypothetical protein